MTQEDIEKAAGDYSGSALGFRDNKAIMEKHKAFVDGANWRINSVWHDVNDRSVIANNNKDLVLLLENGKIVDFDDDWEEYHSFVLAWAYTEDLIPSAYNN